MGDLAWLDTVGIYGAGFMGSGIAESAARSGLNVILYEPEQSALDRSRKRIGTSLVRAVEGDKLTQEEADRLMGRVSFSTSLEDLAPAQIALEAIIEEVEIKHEAFSRMDQALP